MIMIILPYHSYAQTIDTIINERMLLNRSPQIKVDRFPIYVEVNPGENKIYVANYESNTVSVIDSNSGNVTKDIHVGTRPSYIAVDTLKNKIYVANNGENTVSVIDGSTDNKIKDIVVGSYPAYIAIRDKIYVANKGSDTVSVINASNYNKIKDIVVGFSPVYIYESPDRVYVANEGSDNISVIDVSLGSNDNVIKNITVGKEPIYINEGQGNIYVANYDSKTVSVINASNDNVIKNITVAEGPISLAISNFETFRGLGNKVYVGDTFGEVVSVIKASNGDKIKDIPVGFSPTSIAINNAKNMIYVANKGSDTVSVIDSLNDRVVSGITFNISPANSGNIICDSKEYPTNVYIYVATKTTCIAQPNKGFEFTSWAEDLSHNSTIPLNTSAVSDSPFNSLLSSFGIKQNDTSAYFTVTRYGTFTANFKLLPPPIPPEYWIPLYGIIVSSIVGWSLPSIIGWFKSKRHQGKSHHYYKRIDSLYNDRKLDENDLRELNVLKKEIADAYAKGKINEQQYANLKDEICVTYEEIYKKMINSYINKKQELNSMSLDNLKDNIDDAYAKGNITEAHYDLLIKKISNYDKK